MYYGTNLSRSSHNNNLMVHVHAILGIRSLVKLTIYIVRICIYIDVSNCEFVCGKAEDVMADLQKDVKFWEESVGVVDPPRAGLRKIYFTTSIYRYGDGCCTSNRIIKIESESFGKNKFGGLAPTM